MTERTDQTPTTVDSIKSEFQLHLKNVEFGSPDYLAFCDFYALEEQKQYISIEIEQAKKDLPTQDRLMRESQQRVTETRIALLENQIDNNKTTVIGYSKAYSRVEREMETLREAIVEELRDENGEPQDEQWIHQEAGEIYHEILVDDFRDVLNGRFD